MSAKTPDLAGLPMRWPKNARSGCAPLVVELDEEPDASPRFFIAVGFNDLILGIGEARKVRDRLSAAIDEAERRGLK